MSDVMDVNKQKKNKMILALLLLTPLLVMLAATITYKVGYVPETQKNHGKILTPPQEIVQLNLMTPDGESYDYVADNLDYGRWHIFLFGDQACADKECLDPLWLTRQAHVALSHRAQHVKRYYVSVGGNISAELAEKFKKDHPRLKWLSVSKEEYKQFISQFNNDEFDPLNQHQYALVDPNAWMMMYFNPDQPGSDLISDLKYLLKKRGK